MKLLQRATEVFAASLLALIVAVLLGQVVSRYVFSLSLSWPEEVARYLFVWLVFIGGAAAVGAREALVVDSLTTFASPRWKHIARLVAPVGGLIGIAILLYTCMPLLTGPASRTASPASGVRLFWVYLAVPVGSLITAVFLLHALVREWRDGEEETP